MKQMGLKSKLSKKFKVTTDSKHNYMTRNGLQSRGTLQSSNVVYLLFAEWK